jgi:hypothetical protein
LLLYRLLPRNFTPHAVERLPAQRHSARDRVILAGKVTQLFAQQYRVGFGSGERSQCPFAKG